MPTYGDLLNRRFEKASFGGYKAADVDSFMAELATTLSQAGRETTELKRKLEAAEKRLESFENEEDSLKSTLLNAQRLADRIVNEAKEKAELTILEAKAKAENLVDGAQSEIDIRKGEADRIKREVFDFKLSVMRLYKSQLELINEIPAEVPIAKDKQCKVSTQSELQIEETTQVPETPVQKPAETLDNPLQQAHCEPDASTVLKDTGASSIKQKTTAIPQRRESSVQPKSTSQLETAVYPESLAKPENPVVEQQKTQPFETKQAESEAAVMTTRTVKLNLRYNEKTGEYEPLNTKFQSDSETVDSSAKQGKNGDGIKFGADYNIRTDTFNGESAHRRLWRK